MLEVRGVTFIAHTALPVCSRFSAIKPGLVLLLFGSFKEVNAKVTGFAAQDDG